METSLSKLTHSISPLSLHHHRPSISPSISSLSFKPTPSKSPSFFKPQSIKTSSLSISSSLSNHPIVTPKSHQSPDSHPLSPFKTALIAATVTAAIILAKFNLKPAIAAPVSSPVNTVEEEVISDEDREKNLEEYLSSHEDDVEAMKTLLEIRIKNKKVEGATEIIDKLIVLEPEDKEWPLLKSHMYCYSGEVELAKKGFNEILDKDPLRVEAYHGLVMVASQDEAKSSTELEDVEKRIREGAEMVKKGNKKGEFRDFMLLLAQVQVFQGDFGAALEIYKNLVNEEPRDFRPYLCQSIIYSLMGKKDEAEKNFQKYRRLVPEGHPYAQYFDHNLSATKLFSQKAENERKRANV